MINKFPMLHCGTIFVYKSFICSLSFALYFLLYPLQYFECLDINLFLFCVYQYRLLYFGVEFSCSNIFLGVKYVYNSGECATFKKCLYQIFYCLLK